MQEGLPVGDLGEAVDEGRATGAQRLHLGADQHQPGLERVVDVEVVARLAVLRDELRPFSLAMGAIFSAPATGIGQR